MRRSFKLKIDYILTILLFGFAAFLIVGTVIYSLPRDVIDLQMTTRQTSYRLTDTIVTDNLFTTYRNADSEYTSTLVCTNGVERRWFIQTIRSSSAPRPETKSVSEFALPANVIPEDSCHIEVRSIHEVEVLPFVKKNVFDKFESNKFSVGE